MDAVHSNAFTSQSHQATSRQAWSRLQVAEHLQSLKLQGGNGLADFRQPDLCLVFFDIPSVFSEFLSSLVRLIGGGSSTGSGGDKDGRFAGSTLAGWGGW